MIGGSSSSSKRPTQDFGIQKHGFQLPPPFYPAQPTPITHNEQSPLPGTKVHTAHNPSLRPNSMNGNIVFGGYAESDNSSPILPPSASSPPFHQPRMSSNTTPSPTRSSYQGYGHSHHISGPPTLSRMVPYPQAYTSQPPSYLPFKYGYNIPPTYYSPMPPYLPLGNHPPLTPSATPLNKQPEGWPIPDDQVLPCASSAASLGGSEDPRSVERGQRLEAHDLDGEPEHSNIYDLTAQYPAPQHAQNSPSLADRQITSWSAGSIVDIDHQTEHDDFSALRSHLLYHFDRDQFADCCLRLSHIKERFQQTDFALHSILAARSPTLQAILRSPERESVSDGKRLLHLRTADRFITLSAFEAALKVCYGQSSVNFLRPITGVMGLNAPDRSNIMTKRLENAASPMTSALAYLAAGKVLAMPAVALSGLSSAVELLAYENVERALSFALDGLSIPTTERGPTDLPDAYDPAFSGGTYEPYSGDLRRAVLEFVVANFPNPFYLDTAASSVADLDRLPSIGALEPKSSVSHLRLSSIQFGDFACDVNAKPTPQMTQLSSILLSIPYGSLKYILDNLQQATRQQVTRPVVQERERRRLHVLHEQNKPSDEIQAGEDKWKEAGFEESVTEGESGPTITRRWTGSQTEDGKTSA